VIGQFCDGCRRRRHAVQREPPVDRCQALQLDAHHGPPHPRIGRRATEYFGDDAVQILHARLQDPPDDEFERGRRFVELPHHELVDPVIAHRGDALQKDRDERGQSLLGRLVPPGVDDGRGRPPHLIDGRLQDRLIEPVLAVKVIVDGGDVGMRGAADVANRYTGKPARRKQPRAFREQSLTRVLIVRHRLRSSSHPLHRPHL